MKHSVIASTLFILLSIFPSKLFALNLVLEDGSYPGSIQTDIQFNYQYNNSSKNGLFSVSVTNNSKPVTINEILIIPKITAFLFNVPQSVSSVELIRTLNVTGGNSTPVSGWRFPSAGMQNGHIPTPDHHGFWDAGASVGPRFTSGSPDKGIPTGMTYMFDFRLKGDVDDLTIDSILASAPTYTGGSGGGHGGSGGGQGGNHSGSLTGDDGEEPPTIDWDVFFLANVKGSPEGVFDFPLLVPEDVVSPPAAHTPEPCSLALMGIGLAYGACRRLKATHVSRSS